MYIQHIGAIKIKQLAEITTEDRMIRYNVKVGGRGAPAAMAAAAGASLRSSRACSLRDREAYRSAVC